jgi:Tfp pilus assembly protein FimT
MVGSLRFANQRAGLSFVEVVIATMVVGIMAAVAAPRFAEAIQYHSVEMAAKRIVADLELTRSVAYTTGGSQTVRFDAQAGTYQLVGIVDPDRPKATDTTVNITDTPYSCQFRSIDNSVLTYNGHGLPNTGAQIVIRNGSLQRTIRVNATSGRASYQ